MTKIEDKIVDIERLRIKKETLFEWMGDLEGSFLNKKKYESVRRKWNRVIDEIEESLDELHWFSDTKIQIEKQTFWENSVHYEEVIYTCNGEEIKKFKTRIYGKSDFTDFG